MADTDRKRILIVDDDPKNVKILCMLFEDDHDLETAQSGEEALQMMPVFQPDLVLLDLMMPGISGYEVCSGIRSDSRFAQTRIVIVSGRAMRHELKQGYDVGADEYFCKPFDHEALIDKVNNLLATAPSPV